MSTLPIRSNSMLFRIPLTALMLQLSPSGAQLRQGNASQLKGFGKLPFKLVVLLLLLLQADVPSGDPARAAVSADRCGIAIACTTLELCNLLNGQREHFSILHSYRSSSVGS
jgi:hypothetical protein